MPTPAIAFTRWEFVEGETLEGRLRLGWQWDPLRNDPRFQEILAAPEPQTIF
jgi:hypothetical protein